MFIKMSSDLNNYLQKHTNASCKTTAGAEGGFVCTITCHDGRVIKCPGSSKKKAKELALEEWAELSWPKESEEKVAPTKIKLDDVADDSDNVTSSDDEDELFDRLDDIEAMLTDVLAKLDSIPKELLAKLDSIPEDLRRLKNDIKDDNRRQQSDFIDELRRTCPRGGVVAVSACTK
jgi:hypothetical protein